MSDENRPEFTKPLKRKNWPAIYGACKGERLSDGLRSKECVTCRMVSKKRECPWCHTIRGKK